MVIRRLKRPDLIVSLPRYRYPISLRFRLDVMESRERGHLALLVGENDREVGGRGAPSPRTYESSRVSAHAKDHRSKIDQPP